MKANALFVVCRPGSQTDPTAGYLPWQSYVYAIDLDGKTYTQNLSDALITDRRGAIECLTNVLVYHTSYRIVSLTDAMVQDRAEEAERATLNARPVESQPKVA